MLVQKLSELVSALAGQAVQTQKLLDADYLNEWDRFTSLLFSNNSELRDFFWPLAPQRLLIGEFEVSCSLSVGMTRDIELDLQAVPLNVNYSLRHSIKVGETNRITFLVEQSPLFRARELKKEDAHNGEGQ